MTPLTGASLTAGKAHAAPWCRSPQAVRNAAGGQKRPAFGGASRAAGCVAVLARCARHRAAHRAYPGDPIRAMKGVIISAPRY